MRFLFPGIHGGRVNHWAALQIDGQGKIKLSNTNCPTNKNPYPGNWRCIFSIEEVFLTMIKDVFLQMTGETLFTMIEDIILQIIGDIFLQNLGCIISKLGISLCRIEDIILQISRNIFLQNLGCIISKLGIFLWRIEDVFLQNGDGTVSREEFQEMCNNLSPEEVQRFFRFFWFHVFLILMPLLFLYFIFCSRLTNIKFSPWADFAPAQHLQNIIWGLRI